MLGIAAAMPAAAPSAAAEAAAESVDGINAPSHGIPAAEPGRPDLETTSIRFRDALAVGGGHG